MPLAATVRFGRLRHLADFAVAADAPDAPRARERCVVRTERGVELGTLLALTERPLEDPAAARRALLRRATDEDLARAATLRARDEGEGRALVLARVAHHGLAIRFVGAETLLDGERTILYYSAEDRVDLRELARDLERGLGARVELRQTGARDRARACGGVGVWSSINAGP